MRIQVLIENCRRKFQNWNELARQRRELRGMSDRMLKDIGISRVDAERIASRSFPSAGSEPDVTLKRNAQPAATKRTGQPCCP